MLRVTVSFLKDVCGKESVKGTFMLMELLEKVLYVFKRTYPSLDLGNDSYALAFSAMEFMLNAETYFTQLGSRSGKSFFNNSRGEFLKHFNYETVIKKINKGDRMLFLYHPSVSSKHKLPAHGAIGKFHSIEHSIEAKDADKQDQAESADIRINLEISNNGVINLPLEGMVYFGSWHPSSLEVLI